MRMEIQDATGKAYIVEASTNPADWQIVGVATANEDGPSEFDDTEAPTHQWRFYRVVIP